VWASFIAVFRKEFVHIRRDRTVLILALSLPVFEIITFGFLDQNVRDVPTVVVDQDHSSVSRELIARLGATRTFKVTRIVEDPHAARDEITAGRAGVGVVIPPDFHDRRARAAAARILVLIDGSDSTVSAQALASVNGLVLQMSLEEAGHGQPLVPPVSAQPVILFNPSGQTSSFIMPGMLAILVQIVALVLSSTAIVRERENGTLEQLMVSPIHPTGLMLGKLAPYLFIGAIEMAMVLGIMVFGFGVPCQGSLVFLFAMGVVYLFSLLSIGLFVSTRSSSQLQAQQLSQMIFLPSIFLSGYLFPQAGLPAPLYGIGLLLPATHMIAIMRGVMLRAAGPVELAPSVLALTALAVVLGWASIKSVRKGGG
jgi:ABC-type multidrug transport system permease subunit